jgi:DNA-binding CsgD family transcriptional regulator
VVLLAGVAGALNRIEAVSGELLDELSRPAPRIGDVALPLLDAELGQRDPFVLVLDDAYLVTADRSRAILAFLVDHARSRSQLVLVTRGDPGVPLARPRAGGELVEIGAEALAPDANETREVAASGGVELSPSAAEALRERTEGWAAAVMLAALSLRGRDDADARAAELSGDQTEIADYLLEEVLERQPEHLKRFLLGTSILERMTAPLCDAVLGTTDAAASLEAPARSNAFVIAVDNRREWYRYHHPFGDLFRAELGRRRPELLSVYRRRAARAGASGTVPRARRLPTPTRAATSSRRAKSRWPIGTSLRGGGRGRACGCGWSAAPTRRLHPTCSWLSRPLGCSKQAGARWLVSGCRAVGVANVLLGRPEEAVTVLREALALLRGRPDVSHSRVVCLGYLAFAAAEMHSRRDLQRWAVEATQLVAETHLEETGGGAIALTAGALAHQTRGDHAAAASQLERVRQLHPDVRGAWWLDADLALRCADISFGLGDPVGALEFAQVAADALQGYPDAGTLPVRLARLEARIRRGEDYGLTSAELRVLSFLPTHLSLQEIADRLYLSRATVKTHVASIYDKLGVAGRSETVDMIEQSGLGPTDAMLPSASAARPR